MAKTFPFPLPNKITLDMALGAECPRVYLEMAFAYFTVGQARAAEDLLLSRIATHRDRRTAERAQPWRR